MRPENAASRRVLAKVGFREEGLLQRYLDVDGAWRDHLLVAITVEELQRFGDVDVGSRRPRALDLTFGSRSFANRIPCRDRMPWLHSALRSCCRCDLCGG